MPCMRAFLVPVRLSTYGGAGDSGWADCKISLTRIVEGKSACIFTREEAWTKLTLEEAIADLVEAAVLHGSHSEASLKDRLFEGYATTRHSATIARDINRGRPVEPDRPGGAGANRHSGSATLAHHQGHCGPVSDLSQARRFGRAQASRQNCERCKTCENEGRADKHGVAFRVSELREAPRRGCASQVSD